jgi:hypothetical protein
VSQTTPIPKLAAPANRALDSAGVSCVEDLVKFQEDEVRKWHGIGPNALSTLREALRLAGLDFLDSDK